MEPQIINYYKFKKIIIVQYVIKKDKNDFCPNLGKVKTFENIKSLKIEVKNDLYQKLCFPKDLIKYNI